MLWLNLISTTIHFRVTFLINELDQFLSVLVQIYKKAYHEQDTCLILGLIFFRMFLIVEFCYTAAMWIHI